MKAWEIWSCQPSGWITPHPAVIVSHPLRVAHKPEVDVVMCSTRRSQREACPHEVLLDEADGLDWPTLCKCDLLHTFAREDLKHRRGVVTPERRRQIIATILRAHDWV
ncbi:MAG TPA: type II toxin-antitoxin system PemK/MazF family toxin [Verrucomicrobiota bacterium]|nr:type II toxin-antitoxin system PemK/MazF family toxin [Verrucomicrobiota bacterium]HNU49601.1 type II toxin-antitoxin system PemK/MazF family toxin [Verrucomicrobiota bacterium]